MLLNVWKDLRSVDKVVVLALWSCASLHPWPCSRVVRSFRLGVWIVELEVNVFQRSIPAAIYTTVWFGSLSFDLREVCLPAEAWKSVSDMEGMRCNTTSRNYTLMGTCCFERNLLARFSSRPCDFWTIFQWPVNVWICFPWSVKQVLVDNERLWWAEVFLFSDKRRVLERLVSQICNPGSGIPKR